MYWTVTPDGYDESTVYKNNGRYCSTYDAFDKMNEGGLRIEFDMMDVASTS